MHWGHAVSKDLVRWENLPIALYPDELGYIFSGSAVVDWENTAGFSADENPALVAVYTYHNMEKEKAGAADYQSQGIAYSTDKGRTWTKYEGNPVLANQGIKDFRDPKVIWHEPTQKWIMTLAVLDHISFYSSTNLKTWNFESDFGLNWGAHRGVWECPDLFPLKVEGTQQEQWVLLVSIGSGGLNGGSATQYFVGDFDGNSFKLNDTFQQYLKRNEALATDTTQVVEKAVWLDYGSDNYAGVTWSGIPPKDGRRIFMGWMSNWQYAQIVPTYDWRSTMTLPRELKLLPDYTLLQEPVNELRNLMANARAIPEIALDTTFQVVNLVSTNHIQFNLAMNSANQFELTLENDTENIRLIINKAEQQITVDRTLSGATDFHPDFGKKHHAPIKINGNITSVEIFTDNSSVEIFVNGGEYVFTDLIFPRQYYNKLAMQSDGDTKASSFIYHTVNSIWVE